MIIFCCTRITKGSYYCCGIFWILLYNNVGCYYARVFFFCSLIFVFISPFFLLLCTFVLQSITIMFINCVLGPSNVHYLFFHVHCVCMYNGSKLKILCYESFPILCICMDMYFFSPYLFFYSLWQNIMLR